MIHFYREIVTHTIYTRKPLPRIRRLVGMPGRFQLYPRLFTSPGPGSVPELGGDQCRAR